MGKVVEAGPVATLLVSSAPSTPGGVTVSYGNVAARALFGLDFVDRERTPIDELVDPEAGATLRRSSKKVPPPNP